MNVSLLCNNDKLHFVVIENCKLVWTLQCKFKKGEINKSNSMPPKLNTIWGQSPMSFRIETFQNEILFFFFKFISSWFNSVLKRNCCLYLFTNEKYGRKIEECMYSGLYYCTFSNTFIVTVKKKIKKKKVKFNATQ